MTALLIELSEEPRVRQMELNLIWKRRNENVEADALSNMDFTSFTESLRIPVKGEEVQWRVLNEVISASEEIFLQLQSKRENSKRKSGSQVWKRKRTRPENRFKTKEPW